MFRAFFWSIKKSMRLKKICRKLASKPDGGESFMRAFAKGGFDAINPRLNEINEAKEGLFALIRKDPITSKILLNSQITDEELSIIYWKLHGGGAGIYKKGHWIATSSLAFGQTLDFVLRNKDADRERFKQVCYRLWQYFSDNETGEIKD